MGCDGNAMRRNVSYVKRFVVQKDYYGDGCNGCTATDATTMLRDGTFHIWKRRQRYATERFTCETFHIAE